MTDTPLSDDVVETAATAMAEVIAKRHGHQSTETWLNDQRREEARAALEAARYGEMRCALQSIADAEDWNTTDRLRSIARLALNRSGTRFCPTCGGEFDAAEWDASSNCPECETPKPAPFSPALEQAMNRPGDTVGEGELLDWLADNENLELSHGPLDGDMSEGAWHVHRVQGGYNDREWSLVAHGETPTEALTRARTASSTREGL